MGDPVPPWLVHCSTGRCISQAQSRILSNSSAARSVRPPCSCASGIVWRASARYSSSSSGARRRNAATCPATVCTSPRAIGPVSACGMTKALEIRQRAPHQRHKRLERLESVGAERLQVPHREIEQRHQSSSRPPRHRRGRSRRIPGPIANAAAPVHGHRAPAPARGRAAALRGRRRSGRSSREYSRLPAPGSEPTAAGASPRAGPRPAARHREAPANALPRRGRPAPRGAGRHHARFARRLRGWPGRAW